MQTVNWETYMKTLFVEKYPGWVPWGPNTPLIYRIRAFYPVPKSTPNKLISGMLTDTLRPIKKPDGDNIEKIAWDALNQIAYFDDCQIVEWGGCKMYSKTPKVEISIQEWEPL